MTRTYYAHLPPFGVTKKPAKPTIRKRPTGLYVCGIDGEFRVGTGNTAAEAYRYWAEQTRGMG